MCISITVGIWPKTWPGLVHPCMAAAPTHPSIPDLGFVELAEDEEGQWLVNALTGERVQLHGGCWELSFNRDGWGYVTDGADSRWVQDILGTTVHDCSGQWFQMVAGSKSWLDHKLVSQDVKFLGLPICIDNQLLPIKLKMVWTFAAGFNVWWSLRDVQPYISGASRWAKSGRLLSSMW